MKLKVLLPVITLVLLMSCATLIAEEKSTEKAKDDKQTAKKDTLTLEKLYPKKSIFGPSASAASFSANGKYAAYLYRPYQERRHGSDIWIYEVKSGEISRVTSAAVMSQFQKNSRKVCDDRVEKAKKAKKKEDKKKKDVKEDDKVKEEKSDEQKSVVPEEEKTEDVKVVEEEKEEDLRDVVSDKDADDKKAPRYGGIRYIKWSTVSSVMLFVSEGDIYRYDVTTKNITRLTKTISHESSVEFLPDESGYTYKVDGKLMKVTFGSDLIEQLDPKFPNGETLSSYKISPDGKRIAFVAFKWGPEPQGGSKKVDIVNYRDRFMKAKEHNRQTADMPHRAHDKVVYLYEMNDPVDDKAILKEVHRETLDQPRDILGSPHWSENSNRIVFYNYSQKSGQISLFEASVKDKKKDEAKTEEDKTDKDKPKADEEDIFNKAKLVYRYLHTGGPTTPGMTNPRYLSDNHSIVYLSEQTGFRHLHMLDPLYESTRPLTSGRYEVYPGKLSKDRKWMVVTATKEHPSRKEIYKVFMKRGKMVRLSQEDANYRSVAVSPDGTKVMANYIKFGEMPELAFIDTKTKSQKTLTDSHSESAKKLVEPIPEFFDYPNRHGQKIYGHLFKPDDWKKSVKRPLLIYIYGGPLGSRKQVNDGSFQRSSYFFGYYMAKKHGYITCTLDPRGNSGYGGVFEKANYDRVGKPQVEDLVDGVKYLVDKFGVDEDRVALHGWSFGGFQTQMCLYTEPNVFAAGMAGAGPTEWENYNSWYTTGTIGTSREGKTDLEKFSLLPLAKNLKSHLLLVHGMEDSNVLYQDTVRVYRELLKAGKETLVELFLDPTGGHGLGGDVKNLNLFRKYEDFLLRTIGSGKETNAKDSKGKEGNKKPKDKSDKPK